MTGSINGIEAVELLGTADPAAAAAVRNRGRKPVVERTAAQPLTLNGIEGVIFGTAASGPGSTIRLDSADPALALAARRRGQRALVVVNSSGTVVAATPEAPANVSVPVVSGTLIEGQTLSASEGVWTGSPAPTFSYQWQADTAGNGTFANIGGATSNTYLLTSGEVGDDVRVVVTATNGVPPDASANSVETATIAALDTTPAAFSFTDITDATLSTVYESNTITVTSINASVAVTITGGEYSKNGGAYTSSAGTAVVNDTFKVRHTSSGSNSTATNTALTIGGVSDTYTTTTTTGVSDPWPELAAYADFNNDVYKLPELGAETLTNGNFATDPTWGANIAPNGDFATNTDWTGTNWAISGGVATHTPGSTGGLTATPTSSLVTGQAYRFTITTLSRTAGSLSLGFQTGTNVSISGAINGNGTYSGVLVAGAGNTLIRIIPDTAFDGSIDNVSVEPCTNDAAFGDWNVGLGWTISGGVATKAVVGFASGVTLSYVLPTTLSLDKVYYLSYTVASYSGSGTVTPSLQGGATLNGTAVSANGTYTYAFKATAAHTLLVFTSAVTAAFTLDNVSFKEITTTATGRTYGSELITNGTFTGSATGWTLGNTGGTAAATYASNSVSVAGDGTNTAYIDQSFTTIANETYVVSFTGSGAVGAFVNIGTSQGGSQLATHTTTTTAFATSFNFLATGTTTWIRFARTLATSLTVFDNVSVVQITAIGTYPKRSATFAEWFAFTATSTAARTYVDSGGTIRDMEHQQNLQLYSEDMTNGSGWGQAGTGFTANNTTAPDGALTADKVAETATNAALYSSYNTTITSGQVITSSCYFKAGNHDWVMLGATDNVAHVFRVYFDITNGTVGGTLIVGSAAVTASSIASVGSGWYRCQVSGTLSTSTNARIYSHSATADGNPATANGRERYQWGAQLERGSPATAYKATTGSTSGVNAPRFTYANTDRQLRLENAGTNQLLRSQEFDNVYWTSTNATITANSVVAPDGTTTADTVATTTDAGVLFKNTLTLSSATVHTFSAYAKAGVTNYLRFNIGSSPNWVGVTFDLTGAGAVTQTGNNGWTRDANSIVSVGNGWYRCILTFTPSGTASFPLFQPVATSTPTLDANGNATNAGVGSSCYLWGAQVEASAFVTDYIPTTSGTNTRNIETCRMSPEIEAILARAAASIVCRVDMSGTGSQAIVGTGSTGSYLSTTGVANKINTWTSANLEATLPSGSWSDPMGVANAFDVAGRSVVGNGGTVVSDAGATTLKTHAYLARTDTNTSLPYGPGFYDFVGISPERLPDATLQTLAVPA